MEIPPPKSFQILPRILFIHKPSNVLAELHRCKLIIIKPMRHCIHDLPDAASIVHADFNIHGVAVFVATFVATEIKVDD